MLEEFSVLYREAFVSGHIVEDPISRLLVTLSFESGHHLLSLHHFNPYLTHLKKNIQKYPSCKTVEQYDKK